jgi:hypothetical protein
MPSSRSYLLKVTIMADSLLKRLRPVLICACVGLVLGILADIFAKPNTKDEPPVRYYNPVSGRTGYFDGKNLPGVVFLPLLGACFGFAFVVVRKQLNKSKHEDDAGDTSPDGV